MACGFVGITWQWRRAEDQRIEAVQALNSATDTIQSLVRLHTTAWEDSDELGRQAKMILDSLLAPIVDEARAYPELRNSLASASMGSLRLVDHVLPREDALCALRRRGWSSRSWHAKMLLTCGFGTTSPGVLATRQICCWS